MVCHDMEVVGDFARRVIAMTAGRVVADGPTFEVLRDGRVLKDCLLYTSFARVLLLTEWWQASSLFNRLFSRSPRRAWFCALALP